MTRERASLRPVRDALAILGCEFACLGGNCVLDLSIEELVAVDQAHLIHPLHSPAAHLASGPVILVSGQGAVLRDAHGKEYLDGLSQLWNVNVGHGRRELA